MNVPLEAQVQTYLEIYDPLGMAELTPPDTLYGPVVAEVVAIMGESASPEELAAGVHRVLYLSYGTHAGHVRNYLGLAQDLWRLKQAQGAG